MAATAAIRLMTATPQASGGANPASPVIRATAEPTNPKQPLINRIQAVIVARGLKILGMFHLFSYFPGLCLMLIALIQLVNTQPHLPHLPFIERHEFLPIPALVFILLTSIFYADHDFN